MYVSVNGVKLYFDVEGSALVPDGDSMREKPTVVLVHGGPGADHTIYKPAYSQLADIAQVIFYDHRGNGRSEMGDSSQWNLDQWAKDLKGLCDALGIEKPIVCGTSFGGFVALAYAIRYPHHPARLVLTSTAAHVDFERVFDAFERFGGKEARTVAEAYWTNPTSQSRAIYREVCVPLYVAKPNADQSWTSRVLMKDDTALWFNGPNNGQGRMDFRGELASIACPVLVMAGERDPILPIEFSAEIVSRLPEGKVRFERFPKSAHGIVGDEPARYFRELRRFIQEPQ